MAGSRHLLLVGSQKDWARERPVWCREWRPMFTPNEHANTNREEASLPLASHTGSCITWEAALMFGYTGGPEREDRSPRDSITSIHSSWKPISVRPGVESIITGCDGTFPVNLGEFGVYGEGELSNALTGSRSWRASGPLISTACPSLPEIRSQRVPLFGRPKGGSTRSTVASPETPAGLGANHHRRYGKTGRWDGGKGKPDKEPQKLQEGSK